MSETLASSTTDAANGNVVQTAQLNTGTTGDFTLALDFDQTQAAGTTHGAFEAQRHRKALGEWVDTGAVERQEEIRLRSAHRAPHIGIGLV